MQQIDSQGLRLPIKIDSTSNGEFEPIPISKTNRIANRQALEDADKNARRTAKSRRQFLISGCGAATTLLAMNQVNAQAGKVGGFFQLSPEAGLDQVAAAEQLGGDEFIFDVQGHYVNPNGDWLSRVPPNARPYSTFEKAACELTHQVTVLI